MAPKRKAEEVEIDIRGQLAQILGKSVANVGHVRKTEEDTPRISVIDVARGVTGKNANDAAEDVRIMCARYPAVKEKLFIWKFPGSRQRDTPVADLPTIIEFIFLLPGKMAAQVRSEASKLFVRYLGGDLSLVQEVQQMAHIQKHLGEEAPEHPLCLFAAASGSMRSHLAAVTAIDAIDQTGYSNDPYKLLQRGKLLAGPEGRLAMAKQIKLGEFLRSQFPQSQYRVANSILVPFSRKLLKSKLGLGGELFLHMNMGRPRVTYFEEDRPLMMQILSEMDDQIDECRLTLAESARTFLSELVVSL